MNLLQKCHLQSTELSYQPRQNRTAIRVGEKIGNAVSNETLPPYPLLSLIKKSIQNNTNHQSKTSFKHGLKTVSVVESACTGFYRHIVTPPYLYRHSPAATVPSRSSRVGATSALLRYTPWPSRESPYLHRGHSSCRFATVSPGSLTVHAGRATVTPRKKPALFRRPVRPGESRLFLTILKPLRPLPGERRFNTVYMDLMRCLPTSLRFCSGVHRCPKSDRTSETVCFLQKLSKVSSKNITVIVSSRTTN